jgi:hypothetical protein
MPPGHLTRFPSLTLGVNVSRGRGSLSWTGSGALIPCEEKASDVFKRLFIQGSPGEVAAQVRKLELGQSILDSVAGQAKDLERNIGPIIVCHTTGNRRRSSGSSSRLTSGT